MDFRQNFLKLLERIDARHQLKWYLKQKQCLGMVIGQNTHIFSKIGGAEPYLISIGSNTTISTNVTILTHDASIGAIVGRENASDLIGSVTIGNHVFIGSGAIIMYGCAIGDYCIVAAGSVVTKSIPAGNVVGGNPARIICSTEYFVQKSKSHFFSLHGKAKGTKRSAILSSPDKFIVRKEMK